MSPNDIAIRDRRRAPRSLRHWWVEIRSGVGRIWRGRSVDISTAGMRVRLDQPLAVRGVMFVSFDSEDRIGPFWTRFSVVREAGTNEYGLRFLDMPPLATDRLRGVIESEPPVEGTTGPESGAC
jgi:c-di-GMP-binding flagellar brake protein YcgR